MSLSRQNQTENFFYPLRFKDGILRMALTRDKTNSGGGKERNEGRKGNPLWKLCDIKCKSGKGKKQRKANAWETSSLTRFAVPPPRLRTRPFFLFRGVGAPFHRRVSVPLWGSNNEGIQTRSSHLLLCSDLQLQIVFPRQWDVQSGTC